MASAGPDWPDPASFPPLPEPDGAFEPESLLVTLDTGDRVHYLDWGGPTDERWAARNLPPLLLLHGIGTTAWTWAPVARRLRGATRVLAPDLRGHGYSEAPRNGYELDSLAIDALTVLVANGFGPDAGGPPAVLAGHGFGAMVAVEAAIARPTAAAALALVDGGWEDIGETSGQTPDQFVKGLEEPPEVLRSMEAYLADRRDLDPASWNADQERAMREAVVEKYAGHVAPATRRHALLATVGALLAYRPVEALPRLGAPILITVAATGGADDESARERTLALDDALRLLAAAPLVRVVRFEGVGHNLMRYRPVALAGELLALLVLASASTAASA